MTIVPRWEWRTFGERLGAAESRLGSLPAERIQESDDLYLLSRESDASVKVRDGLMDVKRLQSVDDDGLEQWLPVLKASFPLGRDRGARRARRGRRGRARSRSEPAARSTSSWRSSRARARSCAR